jgi:hypothetical protein
MKSQKKNNLLEADPLSEDAVYFGKLKPLAEETYKEYEDLELNDPEELEFGEGITIYPIQYTIAGTFMKTKPGTITSLNAEMGFGKSLVASEVGIMSKRFIYMVPTVTLTSIIGEITKYGLYNADPADGGFIVYESNKKNHVDYLDNLTDPKGKKSIMVVVKDKRVKLVLDQFKRIGLGDNELIVIVDEGHKKNKDMLQYVQPLMNQTLDFHITRELLMSGSAIDPKDNGFETWARKMDTQIGYHIDYFIKARITNKVPNVEWHLIAMESSFFSNVSAWREQITTIVRENRKLTIVSSEDEWNALEPWEWTTREIFELKQATKTVPNFNKTNNKAVLHINTNKTEGLNIFGDSMLIINPGRRNTEAIIQTTSRILRPDNKNKVVRIYLLCENDMDYLRAFYAKTYAYKPWNWGRDAKINSGLVSKSIALMRMLGSGPLDIGQVDACIIMADYTVNDVGAEELIKWWNKNLEETGEETVLTEIRIQDLV